ncbi:MAG: hypothetical protein WCJ24_00600 [Candidatus Saccharibacteria bacterium]
MRLQHPLVPCDNCEARIILEDSGKSIGVDFRQAVREISKFVTAGTLIHNPDVFERVAVEQAAAKDIPVELESGLRACSQAQILGDCNQAAIKFETVETGDRL